MIEKQHLRSGNICLIPNDKSNFDEFASRVIAKPVHEIWRYGATFENGQFVEYEKLFPLDLTPELLIQCGLQKRFPDEKCNIWDSKDDNMRNKSFTLALIEQGWIYPTAPGAVPFHYLHQLQNLYFALTGKELTLNLNP